MNCAPFDVYAIRYARHSGRIAADNYLGKVDFHDAESDLDYPVWALRRGDGSMWWTPASPKTRRASAAASC